MMYRRESGTQSRSPQRHCTRLGKLRRNTGRHPHRRSESSPGRKAQQGVYQLRNWISSPEVTRSRRTVQTARSTLGVTQANLRDTRRLFERGIVTRMEVDTPQNVTGERIRLGMSAKLAVVLYHNEHGMAVPPQALRIDDSGETYVLYRAAPHAETEKVIVTPGRAIAQGLEVQGLSAGYVLTPTL
ncbi:hypothetical protein [Lonsdalea quercina]|uniref:hypothetical protein n=1 Tax=Lonsdalea quercina TaxID=71657 RepID=UPI001267ED19|nr:hypothetical protein [Lonsdalea quercina]